MRRTFIAALLLLLCAAPVLAQQEQAPEYLIRNLRCALESGQITVRFDVVNSGGAAQDTAVAATGLINAEPLATQDVPPLAAGGTSAVALRFPSNLASGVLRLRSTITPGAADSGGGPVVVQTANCTVNAQTAVPTTAPVVEPVEDSESSSIALPGGLTLAPEVLIAAGIAVLCALLIVVAFVALVARALTRRSAPTFPPWQPVYVPAAMLNPATQAGARAGWQDHAASDALPSPCLPMDHAARKVLMGMDGIKLRNWRLEALRASQYDMYGRVGRTQVIAPPKLIRALNRQLDKAQPRPGKWPRSAESLIHALGPSTAWIVNRLTRRIERTSTLPIALDLRLVGDHGTVRILFELYTCTNGGWQIVDAWEPEMMLRGGVIPENFSYTFYGRSPAESPRQFRRRLRAEMAQRLGLMMVQPQPEPALPAHEPPPPAGSTTPAEPVSVSHPAPPPTQEIPRVPEAPAAPPASDPFTFQE